MALDDEVLLSQPFQIVEVSSKSSQPQQQLQQQSQKDSKQNWKYGPASFWYNKLSDDFDQSFFKKKKPIDGKNNEDVATDTDILDTFSLTVGFNEFETPSESYLLVNMLNWEDKVIYDNANIRDKVDLANERIKFAGWIPLAEHRTLSSFQSKVLGKNVDFLIKKEG